jgi:hypothetical protein
MKEYLIRTPAHRGTSFKGSGCGYRRTRKRDAVSLGKFLAKAFSAEPGGPSARRISVYLIEAASARPCSSRRTGRGSSGASSWRSCEALRVGRPAAGPRLRRRHDRRLLEGDAAMKEITGFIAVDRRTDEGFCFREKSATARKDAEAVQLDWKECYKLGWRVVPCVIREAVAEPAQPAEAAP